MVKSGFQVAPSLSGATSGADTKAESQPMQSSPLALQSHPRPTSRGHASAPSPFLAAAFSGQHLQVPLPHTHPGRPFPGNTHRSSDLGRLQPQEFSEVSTSSANDILWGECGSCCKGGLRIVWKSHPRPSLLPVVKSSLY